MSDVLTKEEREYIDNGKRALGSHDTTHPAVVWGCYTRTGFAIIDRLAAEVERLRARNEKLEKVVKAVDEGACVECDRCGGDGHLGRHSNGKLIACEECGGHEDALGEGFVRSDELKAALSALNDGSGGGT